MYFLFYVFLAFIGSHSGFLHVGIKISWFLTHNYSPHPSVLSDSFPRPKMNETTIFFTRCSQVSPHSKSRCFVFKVQKPTIISTRYEAEWELLVVISSWGCLWLSLSVSSISQILKRSPKWLGSGSKIFFFTFSETSHEMKWERKKEGGILKIQERSELKKSGPWSRLG